MKIFAVTMVSLLAVLNVSNAIAGNHYVREHVTKKGTRVKEHRATNPNSSTRDNWSHKGNVNPYTGKKGTKKK